MAPEVILRKLEMIRHLLHDLQPFAAAPLETVVAEHYKVERILELLATSAADLLQHILAERGVVARSYRDVFHQSGVSGLIDEQLALSLVAAAGMRNVLVHLYDEIDMRILHASIEPALRDFPALVAALAPLAGGSEP